MSDQAPGSVTHWIGDLKEGDCAAAQALWDRYFGRLVSLVRKRLGAMPRQVDDEEDVALSAFDSVFRGIETGRFSQLAGRDELWALLVTVAARKAINQGKHARRLKRGGGRVVGGVDRLGSDPDDPAGLDRLPGGEPTPEFAAIVVEETHRLLDRLGDETLRKVALWRLEGLTTGEIADNLGCSMRTVANRLRLIRLKWEQP